MDNTNRGAIWPNKKKEKDTHPDFSGSLNVDGVEYWVNAWRRKDGQPDSAPSLSFSVRAKEAKQAAPARAPAGAPPRRASMDDEIPFAAEFR